MLRGLIDFLSDHFVVHFVDLPGFTTEVPPLRKVSIDAYARFVQRRISELGLTEYVLGGISFGFLVVNFLPPGPGCKAIFAMEPFLGPSGMRMSKRKRLILRTLLTLVQRSRTERVLWKTRWFHGRIGGLNSPNRADQLLQELDPKTFVATALLLLNWNRPLSFHHVPYVLSLNPSDRTIDPTYVTKVFQAGVERLLISPNTIDHYPDTISKSYFEQNISGAEIERIKGFIKV
jgi:hypothetical protein